MHTLVHNAQCRRVGALITDLNLLIDIAKAGRDFDFYYALIPAVGELCNARSKACAHCGEEAA